MKAENPGLMTVKPGGGTGPVVQNAIRDKKKLIAETRANAEPPTLGLEGLENAAESLSKDSIKILDFLLVDQINNTDSDHNSDVLGSMMAACRRAQMSGKDSDKLSFYRHVNDPGFMKIVKQTGSALVGAHILQLIATLVNIAINDRKQWAMEACLKIATLMPTQYDIHQLKYENNHIQNFSGEVNYTGKSDEELKDIWATIHDDAIEDADCG